MSMSAQKCCVPGCMDSGNAHRTLHLFPNPSKDRERFNLWVFAIKGDIIGLSNEEIYRLRRVCHAHFEEKFCCRYNRISNIAVPTLNLPGSLALPQFTVERRPMRQIQESLPSTSTSPEDIQVEESSIFLAEHKHKLKVYAASKENTDPALMKSKDTINPNKEVLVKNFPSVDMLEINVEKNLEPNINTSQSSDILVPDMTEIIKDDSHIQPAVAQCLKGGTYTALPCALEEHNYSAASKSELVIGKDPVSTSTQPSESSNESSNIDSSITKCTQKSNRKKQSQADPVSTLTQPSESRKESSNIDSSITKCTQKSNRKKQSQAGHKGKAVKRTFVTTSEKKLYEKLIETRIKLSKCRNKMKLKSANLKAARKLTSNPAFLATLENFSSTAKLFTLMQFREHKKKSKGRRFSFEEKILGLTILKQAPRGYRFLRKFFILPAPQTLAKLISHANVAPGINKKIFNQLKNVTETMKTEEKLCVLLFDEMFLKAHVSYNEAKDKTTGFVTDGQETKPDYADHAQVYMIRGLIKNYKQPVSYSFSAAATSGPQIAKEIKMIIKELQDAGLIPIATVCDQGANNRKAIKLLLQETRGHCLRQGKDPKSNIMIINESEIIPLYDPPHLLKCIRNNLITKNLEYTVDGKKTISKWEHIEMLHKENPGYKGTRLIPKLSDCHVIPSKISKMKVKFASQLFSKTVGTNMGYLAGKVLPEECCDTADTLLFFDDLFDSQNGSNLKKKQAHGKPLLGAVTPDSVHHKKWTEAIKTLKKMKFVNKNTGKNETVPTLGNWAWTLEGTEVLLKKLESEYNITSVWMRHLNQDPIENFFGSIRSHGCRNTNPTPERFESAFSTLLINNMSSVHAPIGANCEKDFCENLHALIVSDKTEDCKECDLEYLPDITIVDLKEKCDPRIMGTLQYVSGYFIKNVKTKIFKGCQICNNDMLTTDGHEYIKYREYAGRNWLCSPTENVVKCVSAIQDIANTILKEFLEKTNLKELIKTHILMFVDFDFMECQAHKEKNINFLLQTSIRFFIFHYCKDLNKILSGKRNISDNEDKFQIQALKYLKKCIKRKK